MSHAGTPLAITAPSTPAPPRRWRDPLPGFGLTLGWTLTWLGLIVLLPLAALVMRASGLGWSGWKAILTSERVQHALWVSFGSALIAAAVATLIGALIAWVLVRYRFPGRRLLDAMVDLPFALPTAVAGIALTALYSGHGWVGQYLEAAGIQVAQAPAGIVLALIFIGLPFTVRTVQPLLETTGFSLAFARGVGEYGSVIFIAGNIPFVSEIAPLLIVIKLEEFDYAGATGVAVLMPIRR